MKGIERLIAMRQRGKKPETVWINFDLRYIAPKSPSEFQILELSYEPTRDLRPFVGLDVILFANNWRSEVGELYERLQQYAKSITVFVVDFEDDIGFHWLPPYGRIEFGQAHYIERLKAAQTEATHCALTNDKAGYAAAQANEARTREAAPWLNF